MAKHFECECGWEGKKLKKIRKGRTVPGGMLERDEIVCPDCEAPVSSKKISIKDGDLSG
jgi:hypothetical protein